LKREIKLKSRKAIQSVLQQGIFIRANHFSARIFFLSQATNIAIPSELKFVISIPKRHYKRAVDRNAIRRKIRDYIHRHYQPILDMLLLQQRSLHVAIMLSSKLDRIDYQDIALQIEEILHKIKTKIARQ
jgi:ribonuclease P protein component